MLRFSKMSLMTQQMDVNERPVSMKVLPAGFYSEEES